MLSIVISLALAQGIPLKSGATSDLATVDTNKNLKVSEGKSTRATYIAGATGLTTTAAYALGMNAEASRGFWIQQICVGTTVATAAALQTVIVRRVTSAHTGGSAVTQEGTGANGVSQYVPGTGNWTGNTLITPTSGTAGAFIDGWGQTVGELGAGAADPNSLPIVCKKYGESGTQMPYVASGTANGIYVLVSSAGAGGLASGSITITFIAE